MAKETMSFQREYAEAYDWVAQQFKDWAFTLTTSISVLQRLRPASMRIHGNLYRKGHGCLSAALRPAIILSCWTKPTIYWDFPLPAAGHPDDVQLPAGGWREAPAAVQALPEGVSEQSLQFRIFAVPRCKNQYNVYKSREKNKGQDGENDD
ncbi:hypothetical protein MM50RIKEN_12830 [Vescimonas coprocola]|uniref:Uncharacterized protein n=1 Tax=Vescimonas coprocola TaxID=2714355 RepID=A0A810Q0P7_9FIRM|nr:hypothetical protein MM50RIKEN_12830 [Vescimonas coprocola]